MIPQTLIFLLAITLWAYTFKTFRKEIRKFKSTRKGIVLTSFLFFAISYCVIFMVVASAFVERVFYYSTGFPLFLSIAIISTLFTMVIIIKRSEKKRPSSNTSNLIG